MENRYSVLYKKHNLFSTLQKKKVCAQLVVQAKRIKIFHIYKKNPNSFFSFFISINFEFYLINALVYVWVFFKINIYIENFEKFCWNTKLNANLFFLKSVSLFISLCKGAAQSADVCIS